MDVSYTKVHQDACYDPLDGEAFWENKGRRNYDRIFEA